MIPTTAGSLAQCRGANRAAAARLREDRCRQRRSNRFRQTAARVAGNQRIAPAEFPAGMLGADAPTFETYRKGDGVSASSPPRDKQRRACERCAAAASTALRRGRRLSEICRLAVLHLASMYLASDWSGAVPRAIMEISAAYVLVKLQASRRAIAVSRFRTSREWSWKRATG